MPVPSFFQGGSVPGLSMPMQMQMPMSMPMPMMAPPGGQFPFQMQIGIGMPEVDPFSAAGHAFPGGQDGGGPAKKSRNEDELIAESSFAALFPSGIIEISILASQDSSNPSFNLKGQTVPIQVNILATVKQLKDLLSDLFGGMPATKMQLKGKSGFLKDTQTLAALNIGDSTKLELSAKTRGGKK